MITLTKAQIYTKYAGNIDVWLQNGSGNEIALFSDGEWNQIESIIDELSISKQKVSSAKKSDAEKPVKRTYKPITPEKYAEAKEETERFLGVVDANDYEAILSELYKLA